MKPFTEEQAERFIEHLAECHSWYKHIPVLTGAEFIIVVDPDAGRNYSTEHPRLPFGNTKEGYQKAFGLLNYYCNGGEGNLFSSDCQDSMETAGDEGFARQEIFDRFPQHESIRLFPYVGGAFCDVLPVWAKGVDRIAEGYRHENGEDLIRLRTAILEHDHFWQTMSDEERWKYSEDESDGTTTPNQDRYKELEGFVREIHHKLCVGEIDKIRKAVFKLRVHEINER